MNLFFVLFGLDLLNLAIFLPVFSAFVRSLGGTPFTLGVINSSGALVSLLWNPIVGSLSDQVGRKGLLIQCIVASAVGSLIMAFSSSLLLVFVGKIIGSLGSPVGILLRSIVADAYKSPEDKKAFFNKCAPVMSVAFLVGSLSSGFLSEAKNGYSLAFLLMVGTMSLAAFLAKGIVENAIRENEEENKNKPSLMTRGLQGLKRAALDIKGISWVRYGNLFIIKASYELGHAMVLTNIGFILLDEFEVQGRYLGYVFLLTSVISIVSNIVKLKLKSLFDTITDCDMIIKGGLMLIVSFIGMSISRSSLIFLFSLSCMCIVKNFLDITLTEMITTSTVEEDRGKVIGAYENLMQLSGFIAPVLSGLMAGAFGVRMLLVVAALPMGVAVAAANIRKNKTD